MLLEESSTDVSVDDLGDVELQRLDDFLVGHSFGLLCGLDGEGE